MTPTDALPAFLSIPWRDYTGEDNPRLKLWQLCEVYEVLVRFGVMTLLAELRHLPDSERRLDAALADLGPVIEGPTLAQWLAVLTRLGEQLGRSDPLVLAELPEVLTALRALSPEGLGNRALDFGDSLLVLRNTLAHGGGITTSLAGELLAGEDGTPGWDARLRAILDRLGFLAGVHLCWFADGCALRIEPDGTAGAPVTLPADLLATLSTCRLDRRVLLVRGSRCLDLWPLFDYAPASMTGGIKPRSSATPSPQVYYRAEKRRLLYAALGSEVPVHQSSDRLADFRAFFKLDRKRQVPEPPARDFSEEIRAEAAALRGRTAEYQTVADAVKAGGDHVLWVHGVGGVGKSYLVAKLAHNWANSNQYLTVFWRFRAGDVDRCSRHAFLRFAITTLGDPGHGLTGHLVSPSRDPSQLVTQFRELLDAAGEGGAPGGGLRRKLLFVLDGVDEIARTDPDFVRRIYDWRSASAVWLCAGRHEGDAVVGAFAPDRCRHVFGGGLPGMTAEGVRALIDHRIGPRIRELLRHDRDHGAAVGNALVDAIVDRSAGLPLYAHFVCEDILAGHVQFDASLPDRLPASLTAYYEELLRRRGIGDVDALKTPLIVTITWAMAPLDGAALIDLLQRRRALPRDRAKAERILRDGLEALQSMLRPAARPDGGVGYEPYHSTFREHIRADEGLSGEAETARDLYCECAVDWADFPTGGPTRRYLLRHGPEHLASGTRSGDLYGLARSERFLSAQAAELPGEPDAPLRTVRVALRAATEQDDAAGMAEFLLKLAHRRYQLQAEAPLDALRSGNLTRAERLADLMSSSRAALALLLLAWELVEDGRNEEAARLFTKLSQRAAPPLEGDDARSAVNVLAYIAARLPEAAVDSVRVLLSRDNADLADPVLHVLIEHGHLSAAARLCRNFSRHNASIALREVALAWIHLGRMDQAEQLSWWIQHPISAERVHWAIADAYAKQGDLYKAREVLWTFRGWEGDASRWARAVQHARRAVVEGQLGYHEQADTDFATAIEGAIRVEDPRWRVSALEGVAEVLAGVGRAEDALRLVEKALAAGDEIKLASDRYDDLSDFALTLARSGLTDAAVQVATKISEYSVSALAGVFEIVASVPGRGEEARRALAEAARAAGVAGSSADRIALAQASAGFVEDAIATARQAKYGEDRVRVSLTVAEKLYENGLISTAEGLVCEIDEFLGSVTEPGIAGQKDCDLSRVAWLYTRLDRMPDAIRVAESVGGRDQRRNAYAGVGHALARAKKCHEAREMFQPAFAEPSSVPAWWVGPSIRRVAVSLARAGSPSLALRTTALIHESQDLALALQEISDHISDRSPVVRQVREAALCLAPDCRWPASVLAAVALSFGRSGQVSEALWTCPELTQELVEVLCQRGHANTVINAVRTPNDLGKYSKVVSARLRRDSLLWTPLNEHGLHAEVLRWVADWMVNSGHEDPAKQLLFAATHYASQAGDVATCVSVMCRIAKAQAKCAAEDAARATLDQATQWITAAEAHADYWKANGARILTQIGSARATAGQAQEALALADRLRTQKDLGSYSDIQEKRCEVLGAVAVAEMSRGDHAAAMKTAADMWLLDRYPTLMKMAEVRSRAYPDDDLSDILTLAASSFDRASGRSDAVRMADMASRCANLNRMTFATEIYDRAVEIGRRVAQRDRYGSSLLQDLADAAIKLGRVGDVVPLMTLVPDLDGVARPHVLEKLLAAGHRRQFKDLLLHCDAHSRSAWAACALLTDAYPKEVEAIARAMWEACGVAAGSLPGQVDLPTLSGIDLPDSSAGGRPAAGKIGGDLPVCDQYYLVRGSDTTGKQAWYFVGVDRDKVKLFESREGTPNLSLTDFGRIIFSGYGQDPPDHIRNQMREVYGFSEQRPPARDNPA